MGLYELISGAKFLLLAIRKPTLLNPIPKKGSKKNSTLSYTDSVLRLFFPVSYTHLDVYKRQVQYCFSCSTLIVRLNSAGAFSE